MEAFLAGFTTMDRAVCLVRPVVVISWRLVRNHLFFFDELGPSEDHIKLFHGFTEILEADMALLDAPQVFAPLRLLLRHIHHLQLADYLQHLAFHHGRSDLVNSLIACLYADRAPYITNQLSFNFRHVTLDWIDEVLSGYYIRIQCWKGWYIVYQL